MNMSPKKVARMEEDSMHEAHYGYTPTVPFKATRREETRLEQGSLFDFGNSAPKPPKEANHPNRHKKTMKPSPMPVKPSEAPKPYVPRHHSYNEYLKWFNGNSTLALYWFNQQNIKE